MSERKDLDDILIDEEDTIESPERHGRSRKGILLISAVIIIFVLGAYAFMQTTKEEKVQEEQPQIVAEAQKLDSTTTENQEPSSDSTIPNDVTSSDDKNIDDKFNQIVDDIKKKNDIKSDKTDTNKTKTISKVVSKDMDKKMPIQKEAKKVLSSKDKKAKEQMNATVAKTKVNKMPEKKAKVVATKEAKKAGIKAGFYIQVGSFSKFTPSKNFLNTIKENDYHYHLQKIDRGNRKVTKVLIGPFKNRGEATDAINVVRREIEPGAFLKIIK